MRKHLQRAVALCALLSMAPASAWALADPPPGKQDRRIRTVNYSADNVVNISAGVGATLAIEFAAGEQIADVALSNSADLMRATTGDNVVFLKPKRELASQPIIIKTRRPDGSNRLYTFQFQARETTGEQSSDSYYLLRFKYPEDEAKLRAEQARLRAANPPSAKIPRQMRPEPPKRPEDVDPSKMNVRFTAQGNAALAPEMVIDDGEATYLHFGPRQRMPAVFGIGVDGREEAIPYAINGADMVLLSVPRSFLLRDGNSVLRIMNNSLNFVTLPPGLPKELYAPTARPEDQQQPPPRNRR